MTEGGPISRNEFDQLISRAERLCDSVVQSTEFSPIPEVKREGARFVQIVSSSVVELQGLLEQDGQDFGERVRAFEERLVLAEEKVAGWWKPPAARLRTVSGPNRPRRQSRISAA